MDSAVENISKQTEALSVSDQNPDAVPYEVATFALSWFWFPEAQFGCAPGVLRTRVGFTGGKKKSPTYYSLWVEMVSLIAHLPVKRVRMLNVLFLSGDHTETVEIQYDPTKTSYSEMLKLFWTNHDPTQCASRQYMSAIFYHSKEQKQLAEQTKEEESKKRQKKIQTRIAEVETFYNAEEWVILKLWEGMGMYIVEAETCYSTEKWVIPTLQESVVCVL